MPLQQRKIRNRICWGIMVSVWFSMPVCAHAQPVPTGRRLRELADRAGMLIGVCTYGIDREYHAIVEREFNTGVNWLFDGRSTSSRDTSSMPA